MISGAVVTSSRGTPDADPVDMDRGPPHRLVSLAAGCATTLCLFAGAPAAAEPQPAAASSAAPTSSARPPHGASAAPDAETAPAVLGTVHADPTLAARPASSSGGAPKEHKPHPTAPPYPYLAPPGYRSDEPASPYAYTAPVDSSSSEPAFLRPRRSSALMNGGIALTALGSASIVAGVIVALVGVGQSTSYGIGKMWNDATGRSSGSAPPSLMPVAGGLLIGGLVGIGAGIPMVVIGKRRASGDRAVAGPGLAPAPMVPAEDFTSGKDSAAVHIDLRASPRGAWFTCTAGF